MQSLMLICVVTALLGGIPCFSTEADGLDDLLLVAESEQIESLSLGDAVEKNVVADGLQHPSAVDYDASEQRVIFSDTGQHVIASQLLNGTGGSERLTNQELHSPFAGVAFDWISRLVFYSDYQVIVTCRPDGHYTKPVVFTSPSQPGPIVADAQRGLIYWADQSVPGRIERVFYTGYQRQVVANDLGSVTGLALDSEQQLLYWSDKNWGQILVVNVSGIEPSNRSLVLNASDHVNILGLSLSMTSIYWIDQNSSMIYKSSRDGSKTVWFSNVTSDPYALTVYNSSRKTGWNSCSLNNCSQLCLTGMSDRSCSCSYGVLDADGLTCKTPDKYLLVADNHTIRAFVIDESGLHLQDAIEPITGLTKPLFVDYDPLTGNLYYCDPLENAIFEVNMTTRRRRIVLSKLSYPERIAVDWSSRVLYFTDVTDKLIGVVSYSGDIYKKLITSGLDKPRAIVLNHKNGTMYWTDWGSRPKIEMAEKTGEGRRTLVDTGLTWPNGLSLDVDAGKLYWVDANQDKIEVINLNGSGRQLLYSFSGAIHPYSIVVYNKTIYFSDWVNNRGALGRIAVSGGREPLFLNSTYPPFGKRPCGLALYDTTQTPVMTPCEKQGICGEAQLCLQQPNGVECICKYGFYGNATKTCEVPGQFVLFTDGNEVRGMTINSTYSAVVDVFKPIRAAGQVVALDYDAVTRSIYWTDRINGTIMHSTINGRSEVVFSGLSNPEGLAVDWITHNIYGTDADLNVIYVVSFDGRYNAVLINDSLLEPREIAVDPVNGIMYWTDWGLKTIEQATMAGEKRHALMDSKTVQGPTGLSLDLQERKLYWADKVKDLIGEYDLTGANKPKTYRAPSVDLAQFHMSHHAGVVFFSDQNLYGVFRWEIRSSKAYRMVRTRLQPLGVAVYDANRINGTNECSFANGGCSHLCLPVPMGRRCVCMQDNVTSCMGSIVESPKSVAAQEFSTVTFRCKLKPEKEIGVNYLTVTWLWNGMEVNNSANWTNDMAYLKISRVNDTNAGNYTCNVTNKYGSILSQPATLTVIPRKPPDAQDQFLVVSDNDVIRGIDLVSTPTSTVDLFTISGIDNVSSLAVDSSSQKIFWSQEMNGTLTILQSNFKGMIEAFAPKLSGAQCLAVDWIGHHIYYVELVPGRISLTSMDSSFNLVVIPRDIVLVDTLVVDPISGLMFWLVTGLSSKIETATMSGEDRSTFLPALIQRPVALAFDQDGKCLCIVDSYNNLVWYVGVDGTNRQSFAMAVQDGLHLAIGNGTAYISETRTKTVWQWKLGNTTAMTELFELAGGSSAIAFYSRSGQSDQNACSRENGGCQQICLPKPSGRACACPETNKTGCMPSILHGPSDKLVYEGRTVTFHCQVQNTSSLGYSVTTAVWIHNGTELLSYNSSSLPSNGDAILTLTSVDLTNAGFYSCNVSNKYGSVQSDFGFLNIKKASKESGFLLVAETNQILMMDPRNSSGAVPVMSGLDRVLDVDCATSNGSVFVFWVDSVQQVIAKKLLDPLAVAEVIATNVSRPYGIAVDWIGGLVFFTEQAQDFIGVVSMDGDYSLPVLLLDAQDNPGPIAVDPERGWMFWADTEVSNPRIEGAYMSGESRKVIVDSGSGIAKPVAITLDPDGRKLFWIDATIDKIVVIHLQTGVQQTLHEWHHDVSPFGMALNQTAIYWTEQGHKNVYVTPRNDDKNSVEILTTSTTPYGLAFCSSKQRAGNNSCSSSNCDQLCLPEADRGKCACSYGILQSDGATCEIPNEYILLAEKGRIRGFVLNDKSTELKNAIRPISVTRPLMLDYNPLTSNIYYSDLREMAVMEVNLLSGQTRVVLAGLRYPEGVAVDPSSGVVYYCDRELNIIGAVTIERGWSTVIINSNLDEPRAIALDIADGRMYWTDWGTVPKIERAFMSGALREVLLQSDLGWPNAITLDVENDRMYWSDAKFDKIEVANMNGTGRRVLAQFPNRIHPFGLAILNNTIYWTDWQTNDITRVHLSSVTTRQSLRYRYPVLDARSGALTFVNASRKIIPSQCEGNGGCISGSVCLPNVTGVKCACHYGVYNYTSNQCEVPRSFLVISDGDHVRGVDSTSSSNAVLDMFEPLESPKPVGVDYDAVQKMIYWTDVSDGTIYRSSFQGEREVLLRNLSQPEGIAVDWIGRKVYYTDGGLNRIGVVTMDGQQHVVLLRNLSSPRAIVVDPEKGYMFWTEWSSDPKIERADMAGEWRTTLMSKNLVTKPNGLALDRQNQKIYWADAHNDLIGESEVQSLSGFVVFRAPGHDLHPFGLAYFAGTVYFSDQNLNGIFRWVVRDTKARRIVKTDLKPAGVAFYDDNRTSGSNACSFDNGGCPQLCLPIPNGRRCACTRENVLSCQPSILTSPYSVTVEEMNTLTLGCVFMSSNATGLSYTSAQWLKNGNVLKSYNASDLWYTDVVSLEIESVDSNSSGFYACQATNKYGTVLSLPAKVIVEPRKSGSVQVLLAADNDRIRSVRLVSTPTVVVEMFPSILGNGRVIAVDYDMTTGTVVWVESGRNDTSRFVQAFLNGTKKSAFIQSGQVKGLGYDWSRNLIFYTQPDLGRICVSKLTGSSPLVLVHNNTERPLDLVIVPELRLMWWITDSADGQHIMTSTMSGDNVHRFYDDLVTSPSKLAIDRSTKKLIWIDGNKVFQCHFNGEECSSVMLLAISTMDVEGLAATNGTLYIADQANGTIWAWRFNGSSQPTRLLDSTGVGALVTYKLATDLIPTTQPSVVTSSLTTKTAMTMTPSRFKGEPNVTARTPTLPQTTQRVQTTQAVETTQASKSLSTQVTVTVSSAPATSGRSKKTGQTTQPVQTTQATQTGTVRVGTSQMVTTEVESTTGTVPVSSASTSASTSASATSGRSKKTGQTTQTVQTTQATQTGTVRVGTSQMVSTTEVESTTGTVPVSSASTSASATSGRSKKIGQTTQTVQITQATQTGTIRVGTSQMVSTTEVESTTDTVTVSSASTSASATSGRSKKIGQTTQSLQTTQTAQATQASQRAQATTGTIHGRSQSQNVSTTQVQNTTATVAVSSASASGRSKTSTAKISSTSGQVPTNASTQKRTTAPSPASAQFQTNSSSGGLSLAVIVSIVAVVLLLLILVVVLLVIVKKRRSGSYSISREPTAPQSAAQFDNPAFGYRSMIDDEDLNEQDQQVPADPYKVIASDWHEAAVSGSTKSSKKDDKELLI